jgi:hypothetical protein
MKKQFIPNLVQSLTLVFAAIWLGSYITRLFTVYQFFEPVNMELRPLYNSQNLGAIFTILMPSILCNVITFPIFLILFLLYLFVSKINIKNEGWLFITLVVIFVTAPFELYLMTIDYNILTQIVSEKYNIDAVMNLIQKRVMVLSSFPLIEVFCYIALLFINVYKPLRKNEA